MIGWKHLGPRLVLLAMVLVCLMLALNPFVRWNVIRGVQAVTGAKVEMGRVQTSPWSAEVVIHDLVAADPHRPLKNLFEARAVKLRMDPWAFTKRQLLVTQGQVLGLELNTDREIAPQTDPNAPIPRANDVVNQFQQMGKRWLNGEAGSLESDLQQELQSIRLASDLSERWPLAYDALERQATQLKDRLHVLRQQLAEAGNNPLRNRSSYQVAIRDLDVVRKDLFDVRRRLGAMQQQMLMDRDAVTQAKADDIELLGRKMELLELDSDALSEYLLSPQLGRQLATVIHWVRWVRRQTPAHAECFHLAGGRGEDIRFPGIRQVPDVVLRTVRLEGLGNSVDGTIPLEGALTGLNSQPQYHGQPTELVLQIHGDSSMLVQASLDHSGELPRDQLVIDIPRLSQSERLLGDPTQLAVTVSPGHCHFWVRMNLLGDAIDGELVIKQEDVDLVTRLNNRYGGKKLAGRVAASLSHLDRIEASVTLGGTLDSPVWQLRSNLGAQMVSHLRQVYRTEVGARQQAFVEQAQRTVSDRMTSIEQQLDAKKQTILELLESGDTEMARLKQEIAARVDLNDGVLEEASPLREAFQR